MDTCKSLNLNYADTSVVMNNNVQKHGKTQICDRTPFESDTDSKAKEKKSQLLSLDGWENYQKELIQLCFEFWEVNEKQVQVNNSLQSVHSNLISDPELQLPTSLFADENISSENIVGFESRVSLDNIIISEEFQNDECVEINGNVLKSRHKNNPGIRQSSRAINNTIDWKTYGYCSNIDDVKGNERSQRKLLKKFSFYKHTSKQVKPSKKQQSLTSDRYTSSTLKDWRKCKKWSDTEEKFKKHSLDSTCMLSDDIGEIVDKTDFDERSSAFAYPSDIEAKQMEQKVKKLIKSINEKDYKLYTNVDANEPCTATKFGQSNKFRHFFKNAFQGNHNELDLQLLNDYAKYINQKLSTWQSLSDCLDDVRQRMYSKVNITANSDTAVQDAPCKYGPCETIKDEQDGRRARAASPAAVCSNGNGSSYDECNRSKFVENNDGLAASAGTATMGKQKKYNFFKLLNKTKNSVDMTATGAAVVCERTAAPLQRNSVGDVRAMMMTMMNYNDYSCNRCGGGDGDGESSNRFAGGEKTDPQTGGGRGEPRVDPFGGRGDPCSKYGHRRADCGRRRSGRGLRKSFSDTDLPSACCRWSDGESTVAADGEGLQQCCSGCGGLLRRDDDDDDRMARGLWRDRQECFQTVVARLEYVGSTFREQDRLAGLKTLCRVDALAGLGHSAEAVDAFVSALPLSANPDLMIRRAEAAYDWKFFCHLSMWRHSYKE